MNTDYDPNRYGKPPARTVRLTTEERADLLQALSGALELVQRPRLCHDPETPLAGQMRARAERLKALRQKLSSR